MSPALVGACDEVIGLATDGYRQSPPSPSIACRAAACSFRDGQL